jgi:hypothetical protein
MAEENDLVADEAIDEAKKQVSELSDEEAVLRDKWKALSDLAQELVVSDQGLRQLVGSMVASRQLYAMAIHDLDLRFESDKLPYSKVAEEDRVPLKEIFVSSAATQASHPFEENDLLAGFHNTVIPWMKDVSSLHTAEEARLLKEEYAEAEKVRRAENVSLGLGLLPDDEDELDRERSLVLVGWAPALAYLVGKVIDHSLSKALDFNQVIHLAKMSSKNPDHRLLEIGGKAWENCAKSNSSWGKIFTEKYLDKVSGPVDLFIVSDLSATATGSTFQGVASICSSAQYRLRKWATSMGSAMIGCIPFPDQQAVELNTPDWEKLRMFSRLRFVSVETRTDGNYDILVGRTAKIKNVPKGDVEAYVQSNIIKP